MVRFLLRALGFCLVAAAFAALVVDGTRSIAGGRLLQYGIGDTAAWLGGAPFAGLLAELAGAPLPVRAVAGAALAVPGWLASGALGLALLHAGRPQAARPGFSSPAT
ncbi:hypothetical protein [Lichenibacterium ramalinae]|nr:hypothetical protein [Lichenibacterium ramalinae]